MASVLETPQRAANLLTEQIEDTHKGNRPSFTHAAGSELAGPLYERFCASLEEEGVRVSQGIFGARMHVALVNDGPVTILLDA